MHVYIITTFPIVACCVVYDAICIVFYIAIYRVIYRGVEELPEGGSNGERNTNSLVLKNEK